MTNFDLTQPAENGLKRGFTTGSCATAAVKAALLRLLCNESPQSVTVTLPDGVHYLEIPIAGLRANADGSVGAEVIKDAGDDPDQTHRARITATVRRNAAGTVVFRRGEGVGVVTQPGLPVGIGEPAINSVPRAMMMQAVREVLEEGDAAAAGFDLEIGCENGAEIAKRTFNPRLGIEGGISILGTTGIVEPKSMAAFQASVEIYIRVALGDQPPEIVLAPGNLGQRFARASLDIPVKRVVQMANFIGFALECTERVLREGSFRLPRLWLVGHPGKLAKILDRAWDSHSGQSASAAGAVCRVAREFGFDGDLIECIEKSATVEGIIECLGSEPAASRFWTTLEARISRIVAERLPRVDEIAVRLFRMDGTALGGLA